MTQFQTVINIRLLLMPSADMSCEILECFSSQIHWNKFPGIEEQFLMTTWILEDLTSTRLYKNNDIIKSKKNWEQLITNDSKLQGGGWVGVSINVPINLYSFMSKVIRDTQLTICYMLYIHTCYRMIPLNSF